METEEDIKLEDQIFIDKMEKEKIIEKVADIKHVNFTIEILDGCTMPKKAHPTDAAYDLFSRKEIILYPGEIKVIPVGFKLGMQDGWKANILPRSGFTLSTRILIGNSPGTIDAHYRKEVGVIMFNLGIEEFVIHQDDRVAQMDFQKVYNIGLIPVDKIHTEPNSRFGGFGSTGV